MNALSNFYNYSKNKSSTVFNFRKNEEIEKQKEKETNWGKLCYNKYETTKNTSYLYLIHLSKKISDKCSSIIVQLSFFSFNQNCKYDNFPWYTKLYLIMKDQFMQMIKAEKSDVPANMPVVQNEIVEEKKKVETKLSEEKNVHTETITDNFPIQKAYSYQKASDMILPKINKLFRTNTERSDEKEKDFSYEKTVKKILDVTSKNHTKSVINNFMSFSKSFKKIEENENVCDTEESIELVDNNNNKREELSTVIENSAETAVTESSQVVEVLTSNESNSYVVEENSLVDEIKSKIHLKSAWARFNKFLA